MRFPSVGVTVSLFPRHPMNESSSVPRNSLQQWSKWKENVVRNIRTSESSALSEPGPKTDIKDFIHQMDHLFPGSCCLIQGTEVRNKRFQSGKETSFKSNPTV